MFTITVKIEDDKGHVLTDTKRTENTNRDYVRVYLSKLGSNFESYDITWDNEDYTEEEYFACTRCAKVVTSDVRSEPSETDYGTVDAPDIVQYKGYYAFCRFCGSEQEVDFV